MDSQIHVEGQGGLRRKRVRKREKSLPSFVFVHRERERDHVCLLSMGSYRVQKSVFPWHLPRSQVEEVHSWGRGV